MSNPPAGREPLEHAHARRLIDAYLADELAPLDAEQLAAHVETCPACQAELGGATRLLALLGSLPVPPATPDVDERILLAALRDRDRRHENRSWLATLPVVIFRGAVRTTGTLVVAIVTVAFLGAAFVFAAGMITQVALAPGHACYASARHDADARADAGPDRRAPDLAPGGLYPADRSAHPRAHPGSHRRPDGNPRAHPGRDGHA